MSLHHGNLLLLYLFVYTVVQDSIKLDISSIILAVVCNIWAILAQSHIYDAIAPLSKSLFLYCSQDMHEALYDVTVVTNAPSVLFAIHVFCIYSASDSSSVNAPSNPSNIRRTLVGNKIVDYFVLDWTPGFNKLHKDNCKIRQETFKFWDLVRLILEP